MMKRFPLVLLILAVALVASAQVYDSSGRQKVNAETGTVAVTGTITANAGTGSFTVAQSNESLLKATVYAGSSWSVTPSFTDNSSTMNVMPFAALYDTSPPSITDGNAGIPRMTSTRVLMVDGSATTQPVSGTFWQATQPVSGTFWQATQPVSIAAAVTVAQATAANLNATVTDGSGALTIDGTVAISQTTTANDVDVVTLPNVTVGTFPDNEPFNLAQVGATAITAPTSAPASNAAGMVVRILTAEPCENEAKSFYAVDVVTATTVLVATGVGGQHVYICSVNLVTAGANNVAMVAGTGATCGTSTAGMAGGATAAEGWNFAANGGLTLGNGQGSVARTESTGDSVCLITSAAVQLSGTVAYVIE